MRPWITPLRHWKLLKESAENATLLTYQLDWNVIPGSDENATEKRGHDARIRAAEPGPAPKGS